MSRTEAHAGRLIPVTFDGSIEEAMLSILCKKTGINELPDEFDNVDEWFNEVFYKGQYFIHKGRLYQTENREYEEGDDMSFGILNEDGSITYAVTFYNGGTWFGEAVGRVIDKVQPSPASPDEAQKM